MRRGVEAYVYPFHVSVCGWQRLRGGSDVICGGDLCGGSSCVGFGCGWVRIDLVLAGAIASLMLVSV